jgi:hypothetical protein
MATGSWTGCLAVWHAGAAAHPPGRERTRRTANRARLTAAASSRQSCPTRTRPRTRARRPPWRRRSRWASLRSTVGQQRRRHRRVAGVGRSHLRRRDDLAVGSDGHMALVAIESRRVRLVAVARLRVHHRDHPVGRYPLRDHKPAVGGLLDVLADHRGQQLGRLGELGAQPVVAQGIQGPIAVAEQGIHQLLPCLRVVPVADRLAAAA